MRQTAQKKAKVTVLRGRKKKFYNYLMTVRRQYIEQLNFHTEEALAPSQNAGETGMSTHMADLGSDNALHDMELSMITNEGNVIEMIDEAIERIFNGSYGKCMDCGSEINAERLEAKPYAHFCIKCKTIREQNGGYRPEDLY